MPSESGPSNPDRRAEFRAAFRAAAASDHRSSRAACSGPKPKAVIPSPQWRRIILVLGCRVRLAPLLSTRSFQATQRASRRSSSSATARLTATSSATGLKPTLRPHRPKYCPMPTKPSGGRFWRHLDASRAR